MEQIIKVESSQVSNDVVQNDIVLPGVPVQVPAVSMLAEMESKRIAWETGAYRTSNLALYALLADCLLYAAPLESAEANKARTKALDDFYKERGYQIRANTPLVTRVVRAVFGGIDRRRTSTYSLVLRRAKSEGVLPSQLADWIEQSKGIQEIKLAQSKSYVAPKAKVKTAKDQVDALPTLAIVKTESLSVLADPEFIHDQCVLLATQQPDGSYRSLFAT